MAQFNLISRRPEPPRGVNRHLSRSVQAYGGASFAPFGWVHDLVRSAIGDDDEDVKAANKRRAAVRGTVNKTGGFFERVGYNTWSAVGELWYALPEGMRQNIDEWGINRIPGVLAGAAQAGLTAAVSLNPAVIAGATVAGGVWGYNRGAMGTVQDYEKVRSAVVSRPLRAVALNLSEWTQGLTDEDREWLEEQRNLTPGEAWSLFLGGEELTPDTIEEQARAVVASPGSIIIDSALAFVTDPGVLAGKAMLVRKAHSASTRVIRTQADREAALRTPQMRRVLREAQTRSAAQMRNKYFASVAQGDDITAGLAAAAAPVETVATLARTTPLSEQMLTRQEFKRRWNALERRVLAAEKADDPEELTDIMQQALDADAWASFSRMRGYSEAEIAEFRQLRQVLDAVPTDKLSPRAIPYPDGSPNFGKVAASVDPDALYDELVTGGLVPKVDSGWAEAAVSNTWVRQADVAAEPGTVLKSSLKDPDGVPIRGVVVDPDDLAVPEELFHVTTRSRRVNSEGWVRADRVRLPDALNPKGRSVPLYTSADEAARVADDLRDAVELAKFSPATRRVWGEGVVTARRGTVQWGEYIEQVDDRLKALAQQDGWDYPGLDRRLNATDAAGKRKLRSTTFEDLMSYYYSVREARTGVPGLGKITRTELAALDPEDIGTIAVTKSSVKSGALVVDPDASSGELDRLLVYGDVEVGHGENIIPSQPRVPVTGTSPEAALAAAEAGDVSALKALERDPLEVSIAHLIPEDLRGGPQTLDVWASAAMGDERAMTRLRESRADLHNHLQRLKDTRSAITKELEDSWWGGHDRLLDIQAEINMIEPAAKRAEKLYKGAVGAPLRTVPHGSELRVRLTRSKVYRSKMGTPFRALADFHAQHLVRVEGSGSDIQFARFANHKSSKGGFLFTPEEQDVWRTRYINDTTAPGRVALWEEIEAEAVRRVAAAHGMTPGAAQQLVQAGRTGRKFAKQQVDEAVYAAGGRDVVYRNAETNELTQGFFPMMMEHGGEPLELHLPLWATQTANWHAPTNLRDLDKALSTWGQIKARPGNLGKVARGLGEAEQLFHNLWKPAVLLRGAWPMRVVGDEQLRLIALIKLLPSLGDIAAKATGRYNVALDEGTHLPHMLRRAKNYVEDISKDLPDFARAANGEGGFARLQSQIAQPHRTPGLRNVPVRTPSGQELLFESAFGTPQEGYNVWKQNVSARRDYADPNSLLVGRVEETIARDPDFRISKPRLWRGDEKGWENAHADAVNRFVREDLVGQKILAGWSDERIVSWIDSAQAREWREEMSLRSQSPHSWVKLMREEIDDLLPPETGLREVALKRKLGPADAKRTWPNKADRPDVVAHNLEELTNQSALKGLGRRVVSKMFSILAEKPTNHLSRMPFFDFQYQAELRRRARLLGERGTVSDDALNAIKSGAREHALVETQKYLYDLAENNKFAAVLGNLSPFFSAQREVTTVWGTIAARNPVFMHRARLAWTAPEKAGLVYDEKGNMIHADGTATSPLGDKVVPGGERYVIFSMGNQHISDAIEAIPGVRILNDFRINKKSANMVLQMSLGLSPLVAVGINAFAHKVPETDDWIRGLLPMGTTADPRDLLLPTTLKNAQEITSDEGQATKRLTMRLLGEMFVEIETGLREAPRSKAEAKALMAEAREASEKYGWIRAAVQYFSPVALSRVSPYQHYIDAARALREKHPTDWMERFIQNYGEEYLGVTVAVTNSIDGVAPTIAGWRGRQQHKELVERFPEWGGFIVGRDGAGEFHRSLTSANEFNQTVWELQTNTKFTEGSNLNMREERSVEEFYQAYHESKGWYHYTRFMDQIELERERRGLPSLNVKEARGLLQAKRMFVADLAAANPVWWDEYNKTDRRASERRLTAMRTFIKSDALNKRPEVRVLAEYVYLRDFVATELGRRPESTLEARNNMDLRRLWDVATAKMVQDSVEFHDLYYRYLENDLPKAGDEQKGYGDT